MDVLALTDMTKFSHAGSGLETSAFFIIILCPFFNTVLGGLCSPSTKPEEYLLPKSVWIEYA